MRLLSGLIIGVLLQVTLIGQASAQCADPRGNSYCTNGGQVTFTPPAQPSQEQPPQQPQPQQQQPQPAQQQSPAVQPNAPASSDASLTLDPQAAAAGDSVSITGQ